jgi:hypothetical protein
MASDSTAERARQLGGQRPSGAERQVGLPEVITHYLVRLQRGPAQPAAGERLLPTPDAGTSPHGHGRRGGRPGNGHQSGKDLDAAARTFTVGSGIPAAWGEYEPATRGDLLSARLAASASVDTVRNKEPPILVDRTLYSLISE